MNLNAALRVVADYLELDGNALVAYAAEDTLPGYETTPEYGLPYSADGRFLYALVRALKPLNILESGVCEGGSINHMMAALRRNNRGGTITGVDILPNAGRRIPDEYRPFIRLVTEDIKHYVEHPTGVFDFIHEDASHEIHTVRAVYEALPVLLHFGGVIVSHDTATGVREAILTGIRNAGFSEPPLLVQYDESPCGYSVMKYAGVIR
jgi:predicted O-methyltransferase YrrM